MALNKQSVIRIRRHQAMDTERTGTINSATVAAVNDVRHAYTVNCGTKTSFILELEKLHKQSYNIRIMPVRMIVPGSGDKFIVTFRDISDGTVLFVDNYIYVDIDTARETDLGFVELIGTAIRADGTSTPICIACPNSVSIELEPVGTVRAVLMSSFEGLETIDG